MRKAVLLIAVLAIVLASQVCFAVPLPEFINIDSRNNANPSNDPASDDTDGFSVMFPAGCYKFEVNDGAWNAWGRVDLTTANVGWIWVASIYQPSVGNHVLGGSAVRYATAQDALSAHLGEYITLSLPVDEALWFYIGDSNFTDNIGTVTMRMSRQACPNPVPEPASMLLFGSSLIGLLALRKKS